MDTDIPDVRESDEEPPNFDAWDEPDALLTDQPIRERMLDVVFQLRDPTPVAAIADRVDCDTETARDYLEWFVEAGIVRENPGRPDRYELNRSYLRWRRIERIQTEHTDEEIVDELETALTALDDYREQFAARDPKEVSLLEVADADEVAEVWETLSEWNTVQKRAELLDAARRDTLNAGGTTDRIDA
jgi:DNA-binding Lrp family transcriptional regulator